MTNMVRSLLLCVALAGLAACAQPARVSQMSVANVSGGELVEHPGLIGTVTVASVSGGESTNPMWTSEVGNAEFSDALKQSLLANGLASPQANAAIYDLSATLQEVDQPLIGFSLEVTSTVAYRVTRKADGEMVFDQTIVASYTASAGDAFMGSERLRLANEGSIRTNISRFLDAFIDKWATLPEARELDAIARAGEPASGEAPAAAAPTAVPAAKPAPTAATSAPPASSSAKPPGQEAFDAWLSTNRGDLTQKFAHYLQYGDGKGYLVSGLELQDISKVKYIRRTDEGYVADITYKIGGTANVSENTETVLIKVSNDRIVGLESV